jgi:hypothetical protein
LTAAKPQGLYLCGFLIKTCVSNTG